MRLHSSIQIFFVDPKTVVTQILLSHCRCTEELLSITHTRQISNRLIKLLQWLGNRFGQPTIEGALRITLRITHQQLAEILGTTRVTVTRLLGVLQKENVVKRLPKYEFLLTKDQSSAFQLSGLGFDTKFNFAKSVELDCFGDWFKVLQTQKNATTPKIGVLHSVYAKAAYAAYSAIYP